MRFIIWFYYSQISGIQKNGNQFELALSDQNRDPDFKPIKEIRKSNDQKRDNQCLGLNKQGYKNQAKISGNRWNPAFQAKNSRDVPLTHKLNFVSLIYLILHSLQQYILHFLGFNHQFSF